MARWCKQIDFRDITSKIYTSQIPLTDAYQSIHDRLSTVTYTESDSPLYEHLNDFLKDIRDWFGDMVEYNTNNIEEFECAFTELVNFGEQIIKDSFLKCRKVKALCVLR